MSAKTITSEITIYAQAERVWAVLTEPSLTRQYMFDCEALSDWKPGSRLEWKSAKDGVVYVRGHIVRNEYPRILEYTVFDPFGGYADIPANYLTVSITLNEKESATDVSVVQGDFSTVANGEKRYQDSHGGWSYILEKIKTLAEAGA